MRESAKKPDFGYDAGEHRFKHCGRDPQANIVKDGSTVIGKCPSTLTKDKARDLLNAGEYIGKESGETSPDKIWNVHEGVVYEAVPSGKGNYHGYPWCARPGRKMIPRAIKSNLEQKAKEEGFAKEYSNWMKLNG
jgi:hypothetical protein